MYDPESIVTDDPMHMSPDEFREHGRRVVELIARYMERVEQMPVRSRVEPGEILAGLPETPPDRGEDFGAMLADVERVLMPGITHWQSPSFFAYFPANVSGPSILGELLSAGLGVQGMLWQTSPACTELEIRVLDWLAEMLDLPEVFRSSGPGGGVIQDTASSATLCALVAARERATGFVSDREGTDGSLTAYTSREAHSSVEKAVRIAGLGGKRLRLVDTDDAHAMRPTSLERCIVEDRAAGRTPTFVVATVGTTSSHALDPLGPIGEICRRHDVWLHVDAAHAGIAALCPEHRRVHDGLALADSYAVNPHKWMLTNFDCDAFYVADRSALVRALSVLPEYLRNQATESGKVVDYRDWQIPLGRRFRALKLWFVIRWYGVDGLRALVRRHVALARWFADQIEAHPAFELAAPVPLSLVCFRHKGGDAVNERLLEILNASGRLFLTHTKLDGRHTLRFSVGQATTEAHHVEAAWDQIRRTAKNLG